MSIALSSERIVMAGCEVVGVEGWDGLSLRAVAGALAVTPMALYRHIADSAELRSTVLVEIADGLPLVSERGDVATVLDSWARSSREYLRGFPGVAGHLLISWFEVEPVLDRIEALLGAIGREGLSGFEAVAIVNAVFTYVLMRAEAEREVRAAGVVSRSVAMSKKRHPYLASLAEHYEIAEFDAHFEFGLRSVLDGALGASA